MGDTRKVLCKYFLHGACKKGDACAFSHNLSDRPNMACVFYQRGVCSYGSSCRYDHVKVSSHKPAAAQPGPSPPQASSSRQPGQQTQTPIPGPPQALAQAQGHGHAAGPVQASKQPQAQEHAQPQARVHSQAYGQAHGQAHGQARAQVPSHAQQLKVQHVTSQEAGRWAPFHAHSAASPSDPPSDLARAMGGVSLQQSRYASTFLASSTTAAGSGEAQAPGASSSGAAKTQPSLERKGGAIVPEATGSGGTKGAPPFVYRGGGQGASAVGSGETHAAVPPEHPNGSSTSSLPGGSSLPQAGTQAGNGSAAAFHRAMAQGGAAAYGHVEEQYEGQSDEYDEDYGDEFALYEDFFHKPWEQLVPGTIAPPPDTYPSGSQEWEDYYASGETVGYMPEHAPFWQGPAGHAHYPPGPSSSPSGQPSFVPGGSGLGGGSRARGSGAGDSGAGAEGLTLAERLKRTSAAPSAGGQGSGERPIGSGGGAGATAQPAHLRSAAQGSAPPTLPRTAAAAGAAGAAPPSQPYAAAPSLSHAAERAAAPPASSHAAPGLPGAAAGALPRQGLGSGPVAATRAATHTRDTPLCSLATTGRCTLGAQACPNVHGDICPFCKKACLHPLRPEECAEHREVCQRNQRKLEALRRSAEIECSVCLERVLAKAKPSERKFGILSHCDHPHCIACIRGWRAAGSQGEATGLDLEGAVRACPVCRVQSHFVTPSVVWYFSPQEKEDIVNGYKRRLSDIDCRHFNFGNATCPFGTSCFYKHAYKDGRLEETRLRHLGSADGSTVIAKEIRLSDFIASASSRRR